MQLVERAQEVMGTQGRLRNLLRAQRLVSGDLRCVVTRANGQPAVGVYRRREGEEDYRPLAVDVLRMAEGVVVEILTFVPGQFAALGLPRAVC